MISGPGLTSFLLMIGMLGGCQWVEDSRGNKLIWLPPSWRVEKVEDVRCDGNFLALVSGYCLGPAIIKFQTWSVFFLICDIINLLTEYIVLNLPYHWHNPDLTTISFSPFLNLKCVSFTVDHFSDFMPILHNCYRYLYQYNTL